MIFLTVMRFLKTIGNLQFIIDIDRTSFIADTRKFIEDTESAQMEVVDPTAQRKIEKQKHGQINAQEKSDKAAAENGLMKKVKVKNEFDRGLEKQRQKTGKKLYNDIKKKGWENTMLKKSQKTSKGSQNNLGEIGFDTPLENETSKRKISKKKIIEKPIHPRKRKSA